MNFIFDERLSDSPFVDMVWRTQSECADSFISLAVSHCEMIVMRHNLVPPAKRV